MGRVPSRIFKVSYSSLDFLDSFAVFLAIRASLVLFTLFSCAPKSNSYQFFALDTPCRVTLQGDVPQSLFLDIEREVVRIENLMSSYIDESEIGVLNQNGAAAVSMDTFALLQRALGYAKESDGLFDPTIGPLSRLWDITGSRHLHEEESEISGWDERKPPPADEIERALALVSYRDVKLDEDKRVVRFARPGMKLDLGGIAKGFAADQIAKILEAAQAPAGVIDLGGNILLHGTKPNGAPWSVGVRGEGDSYLWGMYIAEPKAVVTSGIYQRYYMYQGKRYHHILSTKTGYPLHIQNSENAEAMFSVTVVTNNSTSADALATMLFIYGVKNGLAEVERRQAAGEDIEALFVTLEDKVYASKRFALLDKEQYRALQNKELSSEDLDPRRIWVFPIKESLQFMNLN